MFAGVRRDTLERGAIDHVIIFDAIAGHSEQNNQPGNAGKFLAEPSNKILDTAAIDILVRRRSVTTQDRQRFRRERVAGELHFRPRTGRIPFEEGLTIPKVS